MLRLSQTVTLLLLVVCGLLTNLRCIEARSQYLDGLLAATIARTPAPQSGGMIKQNPTNLILLTPSVG